MTFWERILNNPVLLSGFLVAGLNLFISDPDQVGRWGTLIETAVPIALAFLVRQQVTGPLTSKKIAKGVVNPPASKEEIKAAEKVLE